MINNNPILASGPSADDVLKFQVKRLVTNNFKSQLFQLETLMEQHDIAMDKLVDVLPQECKNFVELADYLNDAQFDILRRKTLADGNDCYRQFEELIKNFQIEYKQK